MVLETKNIKQQLSQFESIEERLEYLKNKYSNKTAVIVAPGPTLNDYDSNVLRQVFKTRDDLVIIPIKQAYDVCKE